MRVIKLPEETRIELYTTIEMILDCNGNISEFVISYFLMCFCIFFPKTIMQDGIY